jgi:hypothetical protein
MEWKAMESNGVLDDHASVCRESHITVIRSRYTGYATTTTTTFPSFGVITVLEIITLTLVHEDNWFDQQNIDHPNLWLGEDPEGLHATLTPTSALTDVSYKEQRSNQQQY